MFYVRPLSGRIEPYQGNTFRAQRVAEAVDAVASIKTQERSSQTEEGLTPPSAATPVIAAYEKSINPDTPRRRVIFAAELMATNIVIIEEHAELSRAAELFSQRRFRHIPVVDAATTLVGILSDRDILRFSSRKGWETEIVKSIMTQPVLVASEDTEIREIARVMFEEKVGCVPITSSEGSLVGIITRSDILRTLVMQAPLELWR